MAPLKLIQSHPLPPPSIYQHSHTDTSIIHTNVLVIINLHTHTCTHTGRQVPGDPSHRGKPHPTPLPMLVPPHKNDTITSCCPPPRFPRDRSFMFRFCLCPGPTPPSTLLQVLPPWESAGTLSPHADASSFHKNRQERKGGGRLAFQ